MIATDLTTEADIDRALADAAASGSETSALAAEYDARLDLVLVHLDNASRLIIAREQLQGLEDGTAKQLSHIEIFAGVDIAWPDLDVNHYLPHLLEGRYATDKWKQQQRARIADNIASAA